jgi:outer membrane protein OmpA-like peptidoglycan-associated protein
MKKAKKVIICLTGCCLIALGTLRAQDSTARPATDTAVQIRVQDTTASPKDTTIAPVTNHDNPAATQDTTQPKQDVLAQVNVDPNKDKDNAKDDAKQDSKPAKDSASAENAGSVRQLDTRWFISPLLKGQFQDFAFLEKNRKGYLSDANTLPFLSRGNASFAASAYKNLTSRLSVSADLGLSFGHVTNDNVLISQTRSKTYNLLNAAIYYHLLAASYRLQPYITIGINDIINDASYVSAPIGVGAKFNSRKVMVLGQISYGYALSKSISNTTMYSVGVYIPINSKKKKSLDADDTSPYNRPGKDDNKKKDTTTKNGNVVNNIYITINMDSVLKAKGLLDDNGQPIGKGRDGEDDDDGSDGSASGSRRRHKRPLMNLDGFGHDDFREDTIDGMPVVRFVVYFEFNEYGLNSHAFAAIDRVVSHLRQTDNLSVEIKGYTDSVGTDQYNNLLSRKRAKMVLDYLNSRGIPSELMKAKAYGKDNPVADNSDPNQAWLNRRAEIIVRKKQ